MRENLDAFAAAIGSSHIASPAYQEWPTESSCIPTQGSHQASPCLHAHCKFENRSTRTLKPLPLIMIFTRRDYFIPSSRYPMRNVGKNQLLYGSMSLSLLYRASTKKFARYHRVEPPPRFPLALPSPGIAHHLSGGSPHTPTQHCPVLRQKSRPADVASFNKIHAS